MLDLNKLNPPQREAVLYGSGPMLVLAGAGSGKTRVLTHRIARLISEGAPAWSILAITFTNKAAREMRERVIKLSEGAADEAWIMTFHSCCARILRRDIDKLGYSSSFSIYDSDDQLNVIKQISKSMQLEDKVFPPRDIKAKISDAKNRVLSPDEWLREAGDDFRAKKIYEVFLEYERQLKKNNALDFDDLILKTLTLFSEHPPVLEAYQRKFSNVLVDEYQDTNQAQYILVKLLAGARRNLCVVGDDDQSIYGWRGADIRNILDFEKDFPDCKTIKLEQNYRSTSNILDAANQVIAHNQGRKEKTLWTDAGEGERIRVYRALDERDEAAWVARDIERRMKTEGASAGDFAVFYRTNAQSRVIEEAIVRSGVKYRVYGGMKFYDRKEVKDVIAYLRASTNPDDDQALRRIINEPRRGIGDATIEAMARYAEGEGMSLLNAAMSAGEIGLSARAATAVAKFGALMMDIMAAGLDLAPDAFVNAVLEKTSYLQQFANSDDPENESRRQNVMELVGAVDEYARNNPGGGIGDFLENVALVTDIDSMDEKPEAVTLMTVHAAKGLEFPYVYVTGFEEGVFPISRASMDDEQLEEERRLCYVALTRAMRALAITHTLSRTLYNQRKNNPPSRFLSEIPQRLVSDDRKPREGVKLPPASAGGFPKKNALGIPGLSKGFSGVVNASATPVELFSEGDRVAHKMFGEGIITKSEGGRIKIKFADGSERVFASAVAPVKKL